MNVKQLPVISKEPVNVDMQPTAKPVSSFRTALQSIVKSVLSSQDNHAAPRPIDPEKVSFFSKVLREDPTFVFSGIHRY